MTFTIVQADVEDAQALASLHAESWRTAYRGMLPEAFLAGPVVLQDRMQLWSDRLNDAAPDRQLVIKVVSNSTLVGFACVLLDAEPAWGVRLDYLHVKPELKGAGIGSQLFKTCREWIIREAPGQPMHLWVLEGNALARRFYEKKGGSLSEYRIIEVTPGIHVPEVRYVWPLAGMPDMTSLP